MIGVKQPWSNDYLFNNILLKRLPWSFDYEFQNTLKQKLIRKPWSEDYIFQSVLYGDIDVIKQPWSEDYKIGNYNIVKQPWSNDRIVDSGSPFEEIIKTITFYNNKTSIDVDLKKTGSPDVFWKFGNGTTKTTIDPGTINFSSAILRQHSITISDWSLITDIDFFNDTSLIIDINQFANIGLSATNFKVILMYSTASYGDIVSFAGLNAITNFTIRSSNVEGDISVLETMTGLLHLNIRDAPAIYGNLSSLSGLTSLEDIRIGNDILIEGNIADLAPLTALTYFETYATTGLYYTHTTLPDWDACYLRMSACGLSQGEIDAFLGDLDTASTASVQTVNISGSDNKYPSALGMVSVANLEGKGWTVTLATPLLPNGGFETAGAGGADVFGSWIENTTVGSTVNDETVDIVSGGHAFRADMDAAGGVASVYQPVTVVAGNTYKLSLYCKTDGGANSIEWRVRELGSGDYWRQDNETWQAATSHNYESYSSYSLVEAEFIIQTGVTGLNVTLNPTHNADSFSAYFDNVSFEQVSPNIISNGNFHIAGSGGADVFASWNELATGSSTINDETAEFVNNGHSARLDVDGSGSNVFLYTRPSVDAGERYILSFYYKTSDATKAIDLVVHEYTGGSDYLNSSGEWQDTLALIRFDGVITWTLVELPIAIQDGVSKLELDFGRQNGKTSFSCYYDRVSVRKIS